MKWVLKGDFSLARSDLADFSALRIGAKHAGGPTADTGSRQ